VKFINCLQINLRFLNTHILATLLVLGTLAPLGADDLGASKANARPASVASILEAKESNHAEPSSYALRRGKRWELLCVLDETNEQGALLDQLRQRCAQEMQKHGPIMPGEIWILRFYTNRRFDKVNCVGRVRLSEEGQRKDWWIRSQQQIQEPLWKDALGMN
jgi:hypothetical protein